MIYKKCSFSDPVYWELVLVIWHTFETVLRCVLRHERSWWYRSYMRTENTISVTACHHHASDVLHNSKRSCQGVGSVTKRCQDRSRVSDNAWSSIIHLDNFKQSLGTILKLKFQALYFTHSTVLWEWTHYYSEYGRVNQTDLCFTADNCAGI